MGGEKQSCFSAVQNFGLQKAAEFRGADSVQAAGRFIQQEYTGLMEKRASEAQALHGAGRERAHLPVERCFQLKLLRELRDTLRHCSSRKQI